MSDASFVYNTKKKKFQDQVGLFIKYGFGIGHEILETCLNCMPTWSQNMNPSPNSSRIIEAISVSLSHSHTPIPCGCIDSCSWLVFVISLRANSLHLTPNSTVVVVIKRLQMRHVISYWVSGIKKSVTMSVNYFVFLNYYYIIIYLF